MLKRIVIIGLLILMGMAVPVHAQDPDSPDPLGGATEFAQAEERTDVVLMLDWTPK